MTTWNPVNKTNTTLSNSSLTATPSVAVDSTDGVLATLGRNSGKLYFEVTLVSSVNNKATYSGGVMSGDTRDAILGVGLATNSQSLGGAPWSTAFSGSKTEGWAADGAPLSFTGNGNQGMGPAIGSIFSWTIAKNAPLKSGGRVDLHYARPCNLYDIHAINWTVAICTGWAHGVIQSYDASTGALSVLVTSAEPDLFGDAFEVSFAVTVDGDQNGFTSNLDTTPVYAMYPYIWTSTSNGNIGVNAQQETKVIGIGIDLGGHTLGVNAGDGFYTQITGLPSDLVYPLFGSNLGSGISATINFNTPFTYAIPAGYSAYDATIDPTLAALRMTEQALEVARDALGPVHMAYLGIDVLHDGDHATVRCSTLLIEVLRNVVDGNRIPRVHTTIIG